MTYEEKEIEKLHGHVPPEPFFVRWFRAITAPVRLGHEPDRSAQMKEDNEMYEQSVDEEKRELENEEGTIHLDSGDGSSEPFMPWHSPGEMEKTSDEDRARYAQEYDRDRRERGRADDASAGRS